MDGKCQINTFNTGMIPNAHIRDEPLSGCMQTPKYHLYSRSSHFKAVLEEGRPITASLFTHVHCVVQVNCELFRAVLFYIH